jgi:hypothetical protein
MISYEHLSDFFKSDFLFHIHFSTRPPSWDDVITVTVISFTPVHITVKPALRGHIWNKEKVAL